MIGTVEIFGGEFGVLRIDLAQKYYSENNFEEIIRLSMDSFIDDFGIVYHREGINGDYDDFDNVEDLISFIYTGIK